MDFTKEEKSLLLFFETCAVNSSGKVNSQSMNKIDFEIAKRWHENDFIKFGRIPSADLKSTYPNNHWVVLSDKAWKLAHIERRSRAERNPCKYYEAKTN